jgi:hypothetical protein
LSAGAVIGLVSAFGTAWAVGDGEVAAALSGAARPVTEVIIDDFSDKVTAVDLGFNQMSGNTGVINSRESMEGTNTGLVVCPDGSPCFQQFRWDFTGEPDPEVFSGVFWSLFGLTDTLATFDRETVASVFFHEHTLDLDRVDGALREPGGDRSYLTLGLEVTWRGPEPLALRVELKNTSDRGGGRYTRFTISPSETAQLLHWDFRDPDASRVIGPDLDLHAAKTVSLVVERQHLADGIRNPDQGVLDIRRLWFVPDRPAVMPSGDAAFLDLVERRAVQYFLDWSSRKEPSYGIPQDRSTFGDLLSVGGVGFALPALAVAARRGWIGRGRAADMTLGVLRALTAPGASGPEPLGRNRHHGFFYHFLGVDGLRKQNFDFPATEDVDESLNTVELSTIDTGLALMGILAAQSFFDGDAPAERKIRRLAQRIYDEVDWNWMRNREKNQFYLSWKPREAREATPAYEIPDGEGLGHFSGDCRMEEGRRECHPYTLDYYTDEALIVAVLAAGSRTHPVKTDVYCALTRRPDQGGLVRTWPGSLFTYQFLRAFLDTAGWRFDCAGEEPVDWIGNSREAVERVIGFCGEDPPFGTYGPDAWGISAAEGPYDVYRAYGTPPMAVSPTPEQDGTVTYYAAGSAVTLGDAPRRRATRALRAGWRRGHWHHRFGLPDAFNEAIEESPYAKDRSADDVRQAGPWVGRATFAIDQGPLALHLENRRSGFVWKLMERNPNIRRARERFAGGPGRVVGLEVEDARGDGVRMHRTAASGGYTRWLHAGESAGLAFSSPGSGVSSLRVRYANDNHGPLERVTVFLDGESVGVFQPRDTGDWGNGWNIFRWAELPEPVSVGEGGHELRFLVRGGDGYGVELDLVELVP